MDYLSSDQAKKCILLNFYLVSLLNLFELLNFQKVSCADDPGHIPHLANREVFVDDASYFLYYSRIVSRYCKASIWEHS